MNLKKENYVKTVPKDRLQLDNDGYCFFISSHLADFKRKEIMNLLTMNNTRIRRNLINNSIKKIASKMHSNDLFFKSFFLHTTNEKGKSGKKKKKSKKKKTNKQTNKQKNRLRFNFLEVCVSLSNSNAS